MSLLHTSIFRRRELFKVFPRTTTNVSLTSESIKTVMQQCCDPANFEVVGCKYCDIQAARSKNVKAPVIPRYL